MSLAIPLRTVSRLHPPLSRRLHRSFVPDHIANIWRGGHVEKDRFRIPNAVHRVRSAPRNRHKVPCADDPHLIAHADLDLALDEVEEMMAARMRVTVDPVFETIDPNAYLRGLRQQGKLKPVEPLKGLVGFDLHNGEAQLASEAMQRQEKPEA